MSHSLKIPVPFPAIVMPLLFPLVLFFPSSWIFSPFLTVSSLSSFNIISSDIYLFLAPTYSSVSTFPFYNLLSCYSWQHWLHFFSLDLRMLRPLLEIEERVELLSTCFKSVFCLPSIEVLQKEASSPKEGQANVVSNSSMFVSFGFIF